MHSYFVIPMLFGWDAFLIPESNAYFVFISHDGVAEVVSRTAETADELRQRIQNLHYPSDAIVAYTYDAAGRTWHDDSVFLCTNNVTVVESWSNCDWYSRFH